jgi:hypothetical protein
MCGIGSFLSARRFVGVLGIVLGSCWRVPMGRRVGVRLGILGRGSRRIVWLIREDEDDDRICLCVFECFWQVAGCTSYIIWQVVAVLILCSFIYYYN